METTVENIPEKVEPAKHDAPAFLPGSPTDIIKQFDEILGRHLERLMGARQGLEELPMNIFTVSSLILLATRETEIEGFPYLPPERYTIESLFDNLAEMNMEHGGDLESYINDMIAKGLIKVEVDGRLFPGPVVMKMALLFDRLFPKMPGLNLVAYLGQMIDEVLSNRKALKVALSQFDQMLNLQGLPVKKDTDLTQKDGSRLFPHLKVTIPVEPVKKKIITADIKPSDIYSKLQTKKWTATQPPPVVQVSPCMSSKDINRELFADFSDNYADVPVIDRLHKVPEAEDLVQESKAAVPDENVVVHKETSFDPGETADQCDVSSVDMPQADSDNEAGYGSDEAWEQPEDDDIEKRIAAFEEKLGLKCPLCRTSEIISQVTAKGKPYYKCSSEHCSFISWGKPYYLTCPKCENPFLIEFSDSQGKMMLKCPRATCPHWQKFPWEEDSGKDIKALENEQPDDSIKKTRRLVRRKKRVVVRRKS
jgi:hypothetical protein